MNNIKKYLDQDYYVGYVFVDRLCLTNKVKVEDTLFDPLMVKGRVDIIQNT